MTVESVAVLLAALLSVTAVVTDTLLTFGDVAFPATLTVTVIAGYEAAAASTSLRVQVGRVVHVQPVPLIAVTVRPDGGVSVTETAWPAALAPTPELVTVTV